MSLTATSTESFVLPRLKATVKIGPDTPGGDPHRLYDVKFFPYHTAPEAEPVFAVVNLESVVICRLSRADENVVSILNVFAQENVVDDGASDTLNSCVWCFIDQSEPLLAVAGDTGQLKIINAITGRLFTTLVGHGHVTINDLATHPIYPWIVASASMDTSIRIWDLRRWSEPHESACIIICGHGHGHKEGVLTVSWHDRGRYLISGGHDHRVCVWTIPDLDADSSFWREISKDHRKRSSDEVRVIHYPHFVTSAVHTNYVDCVRFFGDSVISKAAEEDKVVLWKITGFNSREPIPGTMTAPKTNEYLDTRNGFVRTLTSSKDGVSKIEIAKQYRDRPAYERCLEFDAPFTQPFYMRFGLLTPSLDYPDLHPILACGNTRSQIHFWDLERLEVGHAGGLDDRGVDGFRVPAKKKKAYEKKGVASRINNPLDRLGRLNPGNSSVRDTASSPSSSRRSSSIGTFDSAALQRQSSTGATSHTSELLATIEAPMPDRAKYAIHDPHKRLRPHREVTLSEFNTKYTRFTTRAVDWSPCGQWCVAVGESAGGVGLITVLQRWGQQGQIGI